MSHCHRHPIDTRTLRRWVTEKQKYIYSSCQPHEKRFTWPGYAITSECRGLRRQWQRQFWQISSHPANPLTSMCGFERSQVWTFHVCVCIYVVLRWLIRWCWAGLVRCKFDICLRLLVFVDWVNSFRPKRRLWFCILRCCIDVFENHGHYFNWLMWSIIQKWKKSFLMI